MLKNESNLGRDAIGRSSLEVAVLMVSIRTVGVVEGQQTSLLLARLATAVRVAGRVHHPVHITITVLHTYSLHFFFTILNLRVHSLSTA